MVKHALILGVELSIYNSCLNFELKANLQVACMQVTSL